MHKFETASQALPNLCSLIMGRGTEVKSRVGLTKEHDGPIQIQLLEPWKREILVPGRKASLPAQIAETMWVFAGRDDVEWLENYLPRAREFSDDGVRWRGGYGPRLRCWVPGEIDQLEHVVNLLKADRGTRRAVMQIYNPSLDSEPGLDIPCNNWVHFMSRLGHLDMHVAVRSNDLMWGWSGINAFEWSFLQEVVAVLTGQRVGALTFSTSSLHLYDRHWDKARALADAAPFDGVAGSIRFKPEEKELARVDELVTEWFRVEKLIREQGALVATNAVLFFPEPLLRAWLRVIQWHWSGDEMYLGPIQGSSLYEAAMMSPKRVLTGEQGPELIKLPKGGALRVPYSAFVEFAVKTHNEKHAAYGDSWKRRGEMLGILANIARKVDRIGGSETSDETSADTAMDLMVYLAKYRVWLTGRGELLGWRQLDSDRPTDTNTLLRELELKVQEPLLTDREATEHFLKREFDSLERSVVQNTPRAPIVDDMLAEAYRLARHLYDNQHDGDDYRGADRD